MDVAKLRPVEVIAVYKTGSLVTMVTDTKDIGHGSDAISALQNMRQTSPAVIYLDTAEYLLIGYGAEAEVESIREELKGTVKLCRTDRTLDLKEAAEYLPVHGNLPQLRQWQKGQALPEIVAQKDRLKISEKHEKDS